jgi:cell division protein FtsQ
LRQIGARPIIWWQASRSPAPSADPWKVATAAKAKPRRPLVKPRKRARRGLWPILPAAAAALGAAAVFILIGRSGEAAPRAQPALTEIERMLDRAGYGLTHITLTGHRLTPDSDIFDAIDLASTPTLLSFDTRAARARVERLSWVERASIERVFPDRIEVHITERTPFAMWRLGSRTYLIDKTGHILAAVAPQTAPSLPRVAGEGAATEAAALFALMAGYPALGRRVELAERVGGRRWTLRLSNGAVIELPAEGVADALSRLPGLMEAARRTGANEIDLRVAGRALVRKGPDERPGSQQVMGQLSDARVAAGGM